MSTSAEKNQMKWRKVSELSRGMKIAVPKARVLAAYGSESAGNNLLENGQGDVAWDEIVDIRKVGSEQVFDIEVEGTHNFVAGHLLDAESGEKLSEQAEKNYLQDIKNNLHAKAKVFFGGIFAHNTSVTSFGINSNFVLADAAENVLEIKSDVVSDDDMIFRVRADGAVFAEAYIGTGADYAEYFYTNDTNLAPGEAVCVDVTMPNAVKRCARSGDNNIMGVVSSHPSIVGNNADGRDKDPHYKIIAMMGQISGKVSTENGAIQIGDSLTGSASAGHLRKANAGESTVGLAMQNFSADKGNIQILISRRNQSLTVENVEQQVTQNIADMGVQDKVDNMISQAQTSLNQQMTDATSQITDLTNQLTLSGQKITNLENLAITLQSQMDELRSQIATPVDIAQISANTEDISYLKQLLGLNNDNNNAGDISILGKFTAESINLTGKLEATDIEAQTLKLENGKTSGKGILPSGETEVMIATPEANKNAKIYITPTGKLSGRNLYVDYDKINDADSFKVELDGSVLDKDVNFNWLIVK